MMLPWIAVVGKVAILGAMLLGLLGMIVPIFPGITVIWALSIIYILFYDMTTSGAWLFVIMSIIAIIGWLADNVLMGGKAYQSGASWKSLALAFVAGLVGSLLLTPLLGIPAALAGLYLAEYMVDKDHDRAMEITKGMAIGWGWAIVARLVLGSMMIIIWAIWAW